ncbi:MAG: class I SAM-dependent methyltransferase [Candidatus Wallbacteria bacterium]
MTYNEWSDSKFVEHYNQNYAMSVEDINKYMTELKLNSNDVLIDFGCGCGDIVDAGSHIAQMAVGVDSSEFQIKLAEQRLKGRKNTKVIHSSFLDCDISNFKITKAFSRKALHHLTDDEKMTFIKKIAPNFEKKAIFYIEDGFFNFDKTILKQKIDDIMAEAAAYYGNRFEKIKKDFTSTILDEYITDYATWEKIFTSCGFEIVEKRPRVMFYGTLIARKIE